MLTKIANTGFSDVTYHGTKSDLKEYYESRAREYEAHARAMRVAKKHAAAFRAISCAGIWWQAANMLGATNLTAD